MHDNLDNAMVEIIANTLMVLSFFTNLNIDLKIYYLRLN